MMNRSLDDLLPGTMLENLATVSIVLYLIMAALPLIISAQVRKGPSYWPAFTFVALASGIPGLYFAVTLGVNTFGVHPSPLTQRLTTIAVLSFAIFLQAGALKRVRQENKDWAAKKKAKAT